MPGRLLLIVNPISGKMRIKSELFGVVKTFCDTGWDVNVYMTRATRDATRIVQERCGEFDRIVACGGDGTLNETVAGALRSHYAGEIGFLPCGTTNDLANSLGIPKTLSKSAETVVRETAKYVDFGSFNRNRYFTYIASFGAFTEVSYSTDQNMKNIFGHAAYLMEAARRLDTLRSHRMRVECDGAVYEDDYLFGATANSFVIGGVLKLKKSEVDLADGYHEVLLIRNPKSSQELAQLSKELLSGNYENRAICFFRGKHIVFSAKEEIPWCVDGEFAGKHENVEIRNLHNRLKIIRP